MGFVSLREDIEEALTAANLVTERLNTRTIKLDDAEKIVSALLKRCKHISATMEEIKCLHSDLSHDTRNRIYTLRNERDDALSKVEQLRAELEVQKKEFEVRLDMAARKITSLRPASRKKKRRVSKLTKSNRAFHLSTR